MPVKTYPLNWEVGAMPHIDQIPERFVPAHVPGAVQLDWARANQVPLPEYAGNVSDYRWMEDSFWLYRTSIDIPSSSDDAQVYFICGGVDYRFQVRIDGKRVHDQEGMFTPFEIRLPSQTGTGCLLEILVFPAPKSHHDGDDRNQANRSVKPAVSYGWDFHPRLIPLGIWQNAWIEVRPACHLLDTETSYKLNDALDEATVTVSVGLSNPGCEKVRWQILNPTQEPIHTIIVTPDQQHIKLSTRIENPQLWWPNGQGGQPLYTSKIELLDENGATLDSHDQRIGFRRIRLVKNVQAWTDPALDEFPRGPMIVPITFEINGRRIFAKGSNWVSPDIFPGRIDAETYRPLLLAARDANLNILRCWGGAIVQKEAFFDQCDELGLMVWQEFPLACNYYEGEDYLKVLDRESRSIIRALRGHPSLVLWCGGNELFNVWSGGGMTEQDHALRLLNRNTLDLDPDRPYMNTSPLYGIGHGYYVFSLPDGAELFEYLPNRRFAAYAEFGVPGPSPAELIEKIIPPDELFPPRPTPTWTIRHAFDAWDGSKTSWLEYDFLLRYFGAFKDLEELVECGQFIQAEGLGFFFEEARRQKPYCSLAMNWCLNDSWPTAANSSILAWPAQPKVAWHKVKAACRPVLASARPGKLRWQPGEMFTADLFMLNDSPLSLAAGSVQAILRLDEVDTPILLWEFPAAESNTNVTGPQLRFQLSELKSKRFRLLLKVAGKPEFDSVYTFLLA